MNCAEPRLKDSRRVSRGGCCAPARAARNVKCFCRGIGERGVARVRGCAREGYIEELNYYSLINIYPHQPRPKLPSRIFHLSSGSYHAESAAEARGNSREPKQTFFRLSGFGDGPGRVPLGRGPTDAAGAYRPTSWRPRWRGRRWGRPRCVPARRNASTRTRQTRQWRDGRRWLTGMRHLARYRKTWRSDRWTS